MISGADLWGPFDPAAPPPWATAIAGAVAAMYPKEAAGLRDQQAASYAVYRDRPEAYIREILRPLVLQDKQAEICQLLLTPPYKVIAVSANNIGKSWLGGALVNWFFDSFDPGVCITTAPEARAVVDVLWTEVRKQRRTAWRFSGPKAPELYDREGHYAKGYTGNTVEAFHGRHDEFMFFLLDEATALKTFVWNGIKSMFKRSGKHFLLGLLNPTDTTSPAFAECESGLYHVVRLSALDHPNIRAQLRNEPPPIPGAVDTDQLEEWFADPIKFEEVRPEDFQAGDVLWPPPQADPVADAYALGRWGKLVNGRRERFCYRAGPEGQARVLGLWPVASPGAVWSDLAWQAAVRKLDGFQQPLRARFRRAPELGCDVARGTSDRADKTSILVQIEGIACEMRSASGWDTTRTMTECVELAVKWARVFNENRPRDVPFLYPEQVPIKVDDGGLGGGVTDQLKAKGFLAVPVTAQTAAAHPERYPIMRDELWFAVPLAARRGEIDLSRLTKRDLRELRRQAMAVKWAPDIHGRRKVEKKEKTIETLGRSPDDMDALNLAFFAAPVASPHGPQSFLSYQGPMPGGVPRPPGPLIVGGV